VCGEVQRFRQVFGAIIFALVTRRRVQVNTNGAMGLANVVKSNLGEWSPQILRKHTACLNNLYKGLVVL
jgi:hypothetical protein